MIPAPWEDSLRLDDDAPRVVLALRKILPTIDTWFFVHYTPAGGLAQRLPQWEGLTDSDTGGHDDQLDDAVEKLVNHDSAEERVATIATSSADLTAHWLKGKAEELAHSGEVLSLCSRCQLRDGSWAHIPMMDFRCPVSPRNVAFLKLALKRMGRGEGIVLESGNSYHYYGTSLLGEADWVKFMGACVLLAPFADVRYIGHRLISGTCILRITSCPQKPSLPRVVALLQERAPSHTQIQKLF